MAGFHAAFFFRPDDEALVQTMFGACRRRARALHVQWHSEIKDSSYAYLTLDGNSYRLDMLLERLRRDLPSVAEGMSSASRAPAERRRLANGLVDVVGRFRMMLYDRYGEGHVPRLRAIQRPATIGMYDLFPRAHPDLWPRLEVTLDVLASWALDEVAPEVALEELHTAFELLLTRAARKSRAPAFAELVDLADRNGWLGDAYTHPVLARFLWENPSHAMSERELLLSLKDQRKASKHRPGSDGAGTWLSMHFWPVSALLERLSENMP